MATRTSASQQPPLNERDQEQFVAKGHASGDQTSLPPPPPPSASSTSAERSVDDETSAGLGVGSAMHSAASAVGSALHAVTDRLTHLTESGSDTAPAEVVESASPLKHDLPADAPPAGRELSENQDKQALLDDDTVQRGESGASRVPKMFHVEPASDKEVLDSTTALSGRTPLQSAPTMSSGAGNYVPPGSEHEGSGIAAVVGSLAHSISETASRAMHAVADPVSDVLHRTSETASQSASNAWTGVRDTLGSAQQSAEESVELARQKTAQVASAAEGTARDLQAGASAQAEAIAEGTKQTAQSALDKTSEMYNSAAEGTRQTAQSALDKSRDMYNSAAETTSAAVESTKGAAVSAKDRALELGGQASEAIQGGTTAQPDASVDLESRAMGESASPQAFKKQTAADSMAQEAQGTTQTWTEAAREKVSELAGTISATTQATANAARTTLFGSSEDAPIISTATGEGGSTLKDDAVHVAKQTRDAGLDAAESAAEKAGEAARSAHDAAERSGLLEFGSIARNEQPPVGDSLTSSFWRGYEQGKAQAAPETAVGPGGEAKEAAPTAHSGVAGSNPEEQARAQILKAAEDLREQDREKVRARAMQPSVEPEKASRIQIKKVAEDIKNLDRQGVHPKHQPQHHDTPAAHAARAHEE